MDVLRSLPRLYGHVVWRCWQAVCTVGDKHLNTLRGFIRDALSRRSATVCDAGRLYVEISQIHRILPLHTQTQNIPLCILQCHIHGDDDNDPNCKFSTTKVMYPAKLSPTVCRLDSMAHNIHARGSPWTLILATYHPPLINGLAAKQNRERRHQRVNSPARRCPQSSAQRSPLSNYFKQFFILQGQTVCTSDEPGTEIVPHNISV